MVEENDQLAVAGNAWAPQIRLPVGSPTRPGWFRHVFLYRQERSRCARVTSEATRAAPRG